jgi:hypothetical protein
MGRYIYIVNIYAPSGTAKRKERDDLYTTEMPQLLQHASYNYVLGGDFNCVLQRTDSTGTPITCAPLTTLIHQSHMTDAWINTGNNTGYTHFTNNAASRIDRMYISSTVHARKIHTQTLAAAFTDHYAVQVTFSGNSSPPPPHHGYSYWKLNGTLLTIPDLKTTFQQHWERWKRKKAWYGTIARWCNICAKREIQRFFKFLGRERAQDTKQQINFYYSCLYDLLQQPADFPDLNIKLKYYKAKIIHLYRTQLQHFKAEAQVHYP